jgi:catechol 2,3-dioxygenase-like lactoylglutathione lyase family enzyme
VTELEAAEKFYRDVFGFESVGRGEIKSEEAEAVTVRGGDLFLELMSPKKPGTPLADFLERKRSAFTQSTGKSARATRPPPISNPKD